MRSQGQSSVEYLLLIAGAVLVAVVVLLLLASGAVPAGGNVLNNNLGGYGNLNLNSGPGGGPVCPNNVCELGEDSSCSDCPITPVCGDGTVSWTETCDTLGNVLCGPTETCNAACTACDPAPPIGGENVLIVRDTRGVANIFSPSDEGAFFGMGYANAEDRLMQMEYVRMYMQGRLSEMIGNRDCINPITGDNCGNSVLADTTLRLMLFDEYARAREPNLDSTTRAFLAAYADGVNQYWADTTQSPTPPGNTLTRYDSAYVFEPWEPYHSLLAWDFMVHTAPPSEEITRMRQFDTYVAGGMSQLAAAQQMYANTLPLYIDELGATVKQGDVSLSDYADMNAYALAHPSFGNVHPTYVPTPHFSHGWAVGGSKTTTGNSVLLGDPKLRIRSPSYWVESHVVGATFNARGVSAPGAPGYFVGFNENVAWTQTAAAGDYTDLYKLTLGTGPNAGKYLYDGVYYPIVTKTEQILVKGDLPVSPAPISADTILGPLVTGILPNAGGDEFVLVTAPHAFTNTHTVQALIGMMRAQDLGDYTSALANWHTPALNNIFADSSGNVGYWSIGAHVTRSPTSPLAGYIAQDGSTSQNEWVEIIPMDMRPHVINPSDGYISSGNNLPIGPWYPIRNGTHYTGGDGGRSLRVRELLAAGTAAGLMSPTNILDMHYDTQNPILRQLVEVGLYQRNNAPTTLTGNAPLALNYLETWYLNGASVLASTSNPYFSLASSMPTSFRANTAPVLSVTYGGGDNGLIAFLRDLRYKIANTSNYTLNSDEVAYINYVFNGAYNAAVNNFGGNPANWDADALLDGVGELDMPYFHLLFQEYQCFVGGSACSSGDRTYTIPSFYGETLWSQKGEIYTQLVDFDSLDQSLSISPIGVSEDYTNSHFDDQASNWVSGALFPAPLSATALAPITESTETIVYVP